MFASRTTVVRWSATILAAVGWGGAAWSWSVHGEAAGIRPGFITALSVGIAFTMTASQWWRMPSQAETRENQAVYALGFQEGLGCGACPLRPEPGSRERAPKLHAIR